MRADETYGKVALILAQAVREGAYRSVMFVSCAHREGTSTAVLKVALLLREAYGMRPLVVELGVHPSPFAELFSLDRSKTTEQLRSGQSSTAESIQQTDSGVAFLLSSTQDGTALPRDVSALVKKILQDTAAFDIVLLDSPPIPMRPDGLAAATVVPRAVLVVEAGHTTTEQLQRIKQELASANVTVLGSILNKHQRLIPGWLYRWLQG